MPAVASYIRKALADEETGRQAAARLEAQQAAVAPADVAPAKPAAPARPAAKAAKKSK